MDSGENITGITKGKNFWFVARVHAGQFTLLAVEKLTFSPLCLHDGESNVNSFYSAIKPGSLLPLISF
jgi:hypothetical protein